VRPPLPMRKNNKKAVIPAAIRLVLNDWRKGETLQTGFPLFFNNFILILLS